jgi:hypothetical protein
MGTGARSKVTPIVLGALGAAMSLFVFPLAFVIAAPGGAARVWSFLMEGGWGVWVIFFVMIVAVLVSIGLSVWMTLRQTAWSWPLAVMPLFVALAGAGFEMLGMSKVMGAVGGASVAPVMKARIIAVGTSEVTVLGILGGVAVLTLFASAAFVSGARALSRVDKGGLGSSAIAALVAGVLGLGVVGALALVWPGFHHSSFGFGWFPALATVAGAILAGVALSDRQADDQAKARALGDLFIACAYGTFGVLVASTVVHGGGFRTALDAIGGASIDPSQRARIMAEGLIDTQAAFTSHLLFLVPIVLVGIAAAAASFRHLGGAVRSALAGVLAPTLVGSVVLLMFMVPRGSRTDALVKMNAKLLPDDVKLAVVPNAPERVRSLGLVFGRSKVQLDGSRVTPTTDLTGSACKAAYDQWMTAEGGRGAITVDASVPWSRVACVLAGTGSLQRLEGKSLVFPARTEGPTALPEPWGALSQPLGGISMVVDNRTGEGAANHVHLGRDTWEARFGDKRETLKGSLSDRMRLIRDKHLDALGVTADPDVRFGDVLRLASSLQLQQLTLEVALTKEDALASRPPSSALGFETFGSGGLGLDGIGSAKHQPDGPSSSKAGRMPPEVIQRIVRKNSGKFRLCYDNGLKKNPKLEGRVSVRFVIGRDGAVSRAEDAGSDLPDKTVVSCVVRAFQALSFPEPEGGIVTVSYPLKFSPGG